MWLEKMSSDRPMIAFWGDSTLKSNGIIMDACDRYINPMFKCHSREQKYWHWWISGWSEYYRQVNPLSCSSYTGSIKIRFNCCILHSSWFLHKKHLKLWIMSLKQTSIYNIDHTSLTFVVIYIHIYYIYTCIKKNWLL